LVIYIIVSMMHGHTNIKICTVCLVKEKLKGKFQTLQNNYEFTISGP